MGDAGAGNAEGDLEGLEALGVFDNEGAMGQESEGIAALADLGEAVGEGSGGTSTPDIPVDIGGGVPLPVKPEAPPEEPETPKEPEKKPVITRAKRRRSLLAEEEGGVLRKPPVHKRSILGK